MRYKLTEGTNVLGKFAAGATVTLTLYNVATEESVSLTAETCNEIGSTGVFKWNSSDIEIQPTVLTEYLWVMSDGTEYQYGKLVLGGYPDNIDAAVSTRSTESGGILDTIAEDVAGLDGAAMRGTDGAYTGTPPTVEQIRAEMDSNSTMFALIVKLCRNAHKVTPTGGTLYIYDGDDDQAAVLEEFELYDKDGNRSSDNFTYMKRVTA